jgi:hypothetical protein
MVMFMGHAARHPAVCMAAQQWRAGGLQGALLGVGRGWAASLVSRKGVQVVYTWLVYGGNRALVQKQQVPDDVML